MKIVGLTGGIGSGKSTVAAVFSRLMIPVYNSDERAKELYFLPEVRSKVEHLLGKEAYLNKNSLNRAFISSKIFSDKKLLESLNSIIHPAVGKDFDDWLKKQTSKFVIKESAILFETEIYKQLDATILVTAEVETRINRVMQRDKLSREQILDRIKNQFPDNEKIKLSTFKITNNEEELVIPQVLKVYENLIAS